jgi:hypothetical protein
MRGAWAGIQFCCDALREGSVEIQRVKKTVEGGVADAKKIYAEVTGVWGWIKQLLVGVGPAKVADRRPDATVISAPKPAAKEVYVDHIPTQDEVVHQFIGHVGEWFDKYAFLKSYTEKRYAEVFGKDVIDQKEVLELTQLQVEVDAAYPALMTLMTSNAPWQLGPIWTQFKEMQDKVKVGQAARQMKQKRERAALVAKQFRERNDRIDRNVTVFLLLLMVAHFWLLIGIIANV